MKKQTPVCYFQSAVKWDLGSKTRNPASGQPGIWTQKISLHVWRQNQSSLLPTPSYVFLVFQGILHSVNIQFEKKKANFFGFVTCCMLSHPNWNRMLRQVQPPPSRQPTEATAFDKGWTGSCHPDAPSGPLSEKDYTQGPVFQGLWRQNPLATPLPGKPWSRMRTGVAAYLILTRPSAKRDLMLDRQQWVQDLCW